MSQPIPSSAPPRIFVSHSHQDNAYCRELVNGLQAHGFAVWYDEHNLGWGALRQTIEREMPLCQHFVAIFSPAAVASEWVNAEIDAALELLRDGILRTLTFVVAEPCAVPLLLRRWKRIEGPAGASVGTVEAVARLAHIIAPPADTQQPSAAAASIPPAAQVIPSTTTDESGTARTEPAGTAHHDIRPRGALRPASTPPVRDSTASVWLADPSLALRATKRQQVLQSHPNREPSPEVTQNVADDLRKLELTGEESAAPSTRQPPAIPPAPISLPPDALPPRLASLGFTAHRSSDLTTILVPIPNEDLKGRLIGREGHNLRAFEATTGVTLTIDDTPEVVILSGTNPIRREIARLALTKLITEGQIHPQRIEQIVAQTRQEVERTTHESLEGEYILPPLCDVPAGPFQMGSDPKRDPEARSDEPLHVVNLPAFQIARYPITVAEYACFVRAGHGSSQLGLFGVAWKMQLQQLDHPVTSVTWYDVVAYTAWLAHLSGQPWRLPSEEEWEKAARWDPLTGESRIYPWGDIFDAARCNTLECGIKTTMPVGKYGAFGASLCGAEDMAGNVWEWTSSPYGSSTDSRLVLRGGSWGVARVDARSACHGSDRPSGLYVDIGFRLAVAPLRAGS